MLGLLVFGLFFKIDNESEETLSELVKQNISQVRGVA
jgi:hypothetical protein